MLLKIINNDMQASLFRSQIVWGKVQKRMFKTYFYTKLLKLEINNLAICDDINAIVFRE